MSNVAASSDSGYPNVLEDDEKAWEMVWPKGSSRSRSAHSGSTVRTQDIALSMACAINQYKGTDLLELKILLEI
jgi:hypothetical protein